MQPTDLTSSLVLGGIVLALVGGIIRYLLAELARRDEAAVAREVALKAELRALAERADQASQRQTEAQLKAMAALEGTIAELRRKEAAQ